MRIIFVDQDDIAASESFVFKSFPDITQANYDFGDVWGDGSGIETYQRTTVINDHIYTSYNKALASISQNGYLNWAKTLTVSTSSSTVLAGFETITNNNGNLLVASSAYFTASDAQTLSFWEIGANGNLNMETHFQVESGNDPVRYFTSICLDSAQNIYAIYFKRDENTLDPLINNYIEVIKFNANKEFQWRKRYAASNTVALSMSSDSVVDSNDNIIIVGRTTDNVPGNECGAILKIDSSGNVIWLKVSNPLVNALFTSVVCDYTNNIYVVGLEISESGTSCLKLTSTGNLDWAKRYENTLTGDNLTPGGKMYFSQYNTIYLCGTFYQTGVGNGAGYAQINPSGDLIFSRYYTDTPFGIGSLMSPFSITLMSNDNVILDPNFAPDFIYGAYTRYITSLPANGDGTGTYGNIIISNYPVTAVNVNGISITDSTATVITSAPSAPTLLSWTTTVTDITAQYVNERLSF